MVFGYITVVDTVYIPGNKVTKRDKKKKKYAILKFDRIVERNVLNNILKVQIHEEQWGI